MNVLPSSNVYEGDILEVVCKVVSHLKNVEVYLTMDKRILKQAPISLSHKFIAFEEHSGELVCKAEWGNVQKETYQTITVKGKKFAASVFSLKFLIPQFFPSCANNKLPMCCLCPTERAVLKAKVDCQAHKHIRGGHFQLFLLHLRVCS